MSGLGASLQEIYVYNDTSLMKEGDNVEQVWVWLNLLIICDSCRYVYSKDKRIQ